MMSKSQLECKHLIVEQLYSYTTTCFKCGFTSLKHCPGLFVKATALRKGKWRGRSSSSSSSTTVFLNRRAAARYRAARGSIFLSAFRE